MAEPCIWTPAHPRPMFATMKRPVLIHLDAERYARALTYLRRAIRCYRILDDALSARDDYPNARRAFDTLPALDAALHRAVKLLTRRAPPRSIWLRPHR